MNNEKLIKLQHLFSVDTRIKKEMIDVAPINIEQYLDETALNDYANRLNDSLMYIFSELKCIYSDIFGCDSKAFEKVCYMEQVIKINFYSCGYDVEKLKQFYKKNISNMELSFINCVKDECVGYSSRENKSFNMANSINEILHFIHSYVINNENILQLIPLLSEKNNEYGYPIKIRGIRVPEFEEIFTKWPSSINCGWTDMVVLSEQKLIMMVRDRGHALTMEISLNNNVARIEYFIPKLCNIEMINDLPGINRVSKDSIGATGIIEVQKETLPEILFEFISRVPMDSDMVLETKKNY